MEADGVHSEQAMLLAKARHAYANSRKNEELASLVCLHNCKKGLFCPVKSACLHYESSCEDHTLVFDVPSSKTCFSKAYHAQHAVKVALTDKGLSGSLRCSCKSSDCLPTLLKTVCNLKDLVQ